MKFVYTTELTEGVKPAKTIYEGNGKTTLIAANYPLNTRMIDVLINRGITGIYVEDALADDVEINEIISPKLINRTADNLKNLNIEKLIYDAKEIARIIIDNSENSFDLFDTRTDDDFIYRHSVAVAEYAVAIGKSLHYKPDDLENVALASLLHDIGKMCIRKDTYKSLPKPLQQIVDNVSVQNEKIHPILGRDILADNLLISARVKASIYCHHENVDGTGLLGLTGDKIYPYAKIIRIADEYDNRVSKVVDGKVSTAEEAIDYIVSNCNSKFDKTMVEHFLRSVPKYPKGVTVELSDGRRAIIIKNSGENALRPIIRTLNGETINLLSVTNLTILGTYAPENALNQAPEQMGRHL